MTREQQARWVLANILDWHRREEKAVWWEFFRLSECTVEELMDERGALAQLELRGYRWEAAPGRRCTATVSPSRRPRCAAVRQCGFPEALLWETLVAIDPTELHRRHPEARSTLRTNTPRPCSPTTWCVQMS